MGGTQDCCTGGGDQHVTHVSRIQTHTSHHYPNRCPLKAKVTLSQIKTNGWHCLLFFCMSQTCMSSSVGELLGFLQTWTLTVVTGAVRSLRVSRVHIKALTYEMALYGTEAEWLQELNFLIKCIILHGTGQQAQRAASGTAKVTAASRTPRHKQRDCATLLQSVTAITLTNGFLSLLLKAQKARWLCRGHFKSWITWSDIKTDILYMTHILPPTLSWIWTHFEWLSAGEKENCKKEKLNGSQNAVWFYTCIQ